MAAINYKNFTVNSSGDDAPWSDVEVQLHKDLIDTMVKDCSSALADTSNGHRHYRLWGTSNVVGVRCTTVGVQRFEFSASQYMQFNTNSSGDTTIKTTGGNIYFTDSSGNSSLTIESDRDYVLTLGDAAGVKKFQINDNANVLQASVDSDGNLYVANDIYRTGITDYSSSSTIVGWAGGYDRAIYYKLIGKLCSCWYYITGTSNAATVTFTLPNNNSNALPVVNMCATQDATSTRQAGIAYMAQNSNVVTVYPSAAYDSWTTTGNKTIHGTLIYNIA